MWANLLGPHLYISEPSYTTLTSVFSHKTPFSHCPLCGRELVDLEHLKEAPKMLQLTFHLNIKHLWAVQELEGWRLKWNLLHTEIWNSSSTASIDWESRGRWGTESVIERPAWWVYGINGCDVVKLEQASQGICVNTNQTGPALAQSCAQFSLVAAGEGWGNWSRPCWSEWW